VFCLMAGRNIACPGAAQPLRLAKPQYAATSLRAKPFPPQLTFNLRQPPGIDEKCPRR